MNPISLCLMVGRGRAGEAARLVDSVRPHIREVCWAFTASPGDDPALDRLGTRHKKDKVAYVPECLDAEGHILDFSLPRNSAFALAAQPWRMILDSDDTVVHPEKLREALRAVPLPAAAGTAIVLPFLCDGVALTRPFLLHGNGFHWKYRVHEQLVSVHQRFVFQGISVHHGAYASKASSSEDRNLRILRYAIAHDPPTFHNFWQLGLHYLRLCLFVPAANAFQESLTLSNTCDAPYDAASAVAVCHLQLAEIAVASLNTVAAERHIQVAMTALPGDAVPRRLAAWIRYAAFVRSPGRSTLRDVRHAVDEALARTEGEHWDELLRGVQRGPASDAMMRHLQKHLAEELTP